MDRDSETIRQEAERWFARRSGGALSGLEEAEFRRWRQRSEAHARAYAAAEQAWARLAPLRDSPLAQRMADELLRAAPARRRESAVRWRPLLLFTCLAALAAVGVARLLLPGTGSPEPAPAYVTGLGEQRIELLADGSQVVLNTDTDLRVRFSRGRREVRLQRGEAMFEVARDEARPFVVVAGDGTVTALGTRFQVRALGDEVAVTLLEGSVEVAREARHERRRLSPGERARYAAAGAGILLSRVDPAAALGWTQGRLEFDQAPLAEVVAEANRYAAVKLRLGDPGLAAMPISGTFRAGNNADVAAGLTAVYDLRTGRRADGEIVLLPAQ